MKFIILQKKKGLYNLLTIDPRFKDNLLCMVAKNSTWPFLLIQTVKQENYHIIQKKMHQDEGLPLVLLFHSEV